MAEIERSAWGENGSDFVKSGMVPHTNSVSAWRGALAVGSWGLLCVVDLSPVWWGDDASLRGWSNGIALSALTLATLSLAIHNRSCVCSAVCSGRFVPRERAAALQGIAPSMMVPGESPQTESQTWQADCWAAAAHASLMCGAVVWLSMHTVSGRVQQVLFGAATLYTLLSLAVLQYASLPGTGDLLPAAKKMSSRSGVKSNGTSFDYCFGDVDVVPRHTQPGAAGQPTKFSTLHPAPLAAGFAGAEGGDAATEAAATTCLKTTARSSSGRWKPLFKTGPQLESCALLSHSWGGAEEMEPIDGVKRETSSPNIFGARFSPSSKTTKGCATPSIGRCVSSDSDTEQVETDGRVTIKSAFSDVSVDVSAESVVGIGDVASRKTANFGQEADVEQSDSGFSDVSVEVPCSMP
eukprot:TRINITY_DN26043_c0_g1_i2.p1 TRINITY_DN26043_c0_g1~~TRINITY_DN26043_c0_g1_i2.p1  ORF type:complete len:427 (+),score=46.62 TRINITY_DN26043_c0_g1_i2:55-1281(+)